MLFGGEQPGCARQRTSRGRSRPSSSSTSASSGSSPLHSTPGTCRPERGPTSPPHTEEPPDRDAPHRPARWRHELASAARLVEARPTGAVGRGAVGGLGQGLRSTVGGDPRRRRSRGAARVDAEPRGRAPAVDRDLLALGCSAGCGDRHRGARTCGHRTPALRAERSAEKISPGHSPHDRRLGCVVGSDGTVLQRRSRVRCPTHLVAGVAWLTCCGGRSVKGGGGSGPSTRPPASERGVSPAGRTLRAARDTFTSPP